jgi:hypothetical protein
MRYDQRLQSNPSLFLDFGQFIDTIDLELTANKNQL